MSKSEQNRGILCHECGARSSVDFTRTNITNNTQRRRRSCPNGHVFRSVETVETGERFFDVRLRVLNGRIVAGEAK